jgi:cation:H+ antiporter
MTIKTAILWTIGSIVLLMIASQMLVEGAVIIATTMGVSQLVIGLTIIAIGTSLPELAAAIAAARKGAHDMIIGNIIGSNVFNTLGVLGLTGAIQKTTIDTAALARDFPIMLLFTIAMFLFANSKGHFSRREGAFLLSAYVIYVCYLVYITLH